MDTLVCTHLQVHAHTQTHTHRNRDKRTATDKKPRTLAQKKGQNYRQDTDKQTHTLIHTHKHTHTQTHTYTHAGIRAVLSYNVIPFNVTFPLHCGALNGPVNNQKHNGPTAGRQRPDT